MPEQDSYDRYGGRGITVCERWFDYPNFLEDMGQRPDNTSIDRIDNDGNYSCGKCKQCLANGWPANCKWSTRSEQRANTSANVIITHNGVTDTRTGWSKRTGLSLNTIRKRISLGWKLEDVFSQPANSDIKFNIRRFEHDGKLMTIPQWAQHTGISKSVIANRISSGMSMADVIGKPVRKLRPRKPKTV